MPPELSSRRKVCNHAGRPASQLPRLIELDAERKIKRLLFAEPEVWLCCRLAEKCLVFLKSQSPTMIGAI